jgi:serine phosphatase RsbU (regulator of sigma subunit)
MSEDLAFKLAVAEKKLAEARAQLAAQEQLLRTTGDTLVQDAEQVVSVLAELEERDRMIATDLQHALRFQRAILPPKPEFPDLDVEVIYLPAEIVSGDVYDVARLEDGVVRLLVADATGHGIAAALTTMFVKSQYDLVKWAYRSPTKLLAALNDSMSVYGNAEMRFTAICADYIPAQNKITYATAAHPGPLVVSKDGARWLESGGPFLGLDAGTVYPQWSATFAKEESIYFVTDGLADAAAPDGTTFGEERIVQLIEEAYHANEAVAMRLMPALAAFVGEDRSLADDVTLLGLRPR